MTCTQAQGYKCGGVCTAVISLYDRYDFVPNDWWQDPLYVLAEQIPGDLLGISMPFQVAAQWRASYKFDAGFKPNLSSAKHENIK